MAITWLQDLFKKKAKEVPNSDPAVMGQSTAPCPTPPAAQLTVRAAQASGSAELPPPSFPDPRQALLQKLRADGPVSFSLPKPDLDTGKGSMDGMPGFIPPSSRMPIASDPREQNRISELISRIDPEALKAFLEMKDLPDIKPPSDKSVRNF